MVPKGRWRAWSIAAALTLAVAWPTAAAVPAMAGQAVTSQARTVGTAVCPPASAHGKLSCAVQISKPSSPVFGMQAATSPSGYGPAGLQSAYGIQATTLGARQTVAIIAAGGDPNAEADLGVYRTQYSLPACTTADGCLSIVDQSGGTVVAGGPAQTSTDLDMVSAVCPNCHLLLVEAAGASIDDLGAAVNEAVTLGAHIVNISYGGPEDSNDASWDSSYFTHPGVAIIASAGNGTGYSGNVNYPAASPDVISVGGTVLDKAGATGCTSAQGGARGWCEAVWPGTISGCSRYEPKPSWQGNTGCSGRADNDLAAVAASTASATPIAIYDSYDLGGWSVAGGTGVASPVIAGIYADAGTPGASDNPSSYPYLNPGGGYINPGTAYPYFDGLNDITSGSTGTCSVGDLCTAGAGWDGPAGLGSPAATMSLTATGSISSHLYDDLGASNMCAANNGPIPAASNPIQIYTCNLGTDQNWMLNSNGTIQLSNDTHDCMTTQGNTSGSLITLYSCNGQNSPTALQEWRLMGDGHLVNKSSGLCLNNPGDSTTNGTQLQIWSCVTNASERWVSLSPIPATSGEIKLLPHPGYCMDNNHGVFANGNPVDIWTCNGGNNTQTWNIEANTTIQINNSGYCFSVSGGGTTNGTGVTVSTCNGHTDQEWIPRSNASLLNLKSASCLDDPSGSTTSGTQLQIWSCNTNPQQGWQLP